MKMRAIHGCNTAAPEHRASLRNDDGRQTLDTPTVVVVVVGHSLVRDAVLARSLQPSLLLLGGCIRVARLDVRWEQNGIQLSHADLRSSTANHARALSRHALMRARGSESRCNVGNDPNAHATATTPIIRRARTRSSPDVSTAWNNS